MTVRVIIEVRGGVVEPVICAEDDDQNKEQATTTGPVARLKWWRDRMIADNYLDEDTPNGPEPMLVTLDAIIERLEEGT